jgi:hypothetical protein
MGVAMYIYDGFNNMKRGERERERERESKGGGGERCVGCILYIQYIIIWLQ